MTMTEYGFATDTPEGDAYDLLTFEQRDEVDEITADRWREIVFDMPARPGTKR